eukprot:g1486.t1
MPPKQKCYVRLCDVGWAPKDVPDQVVDRPGLFYAYESGGWSYFRCKLCRKYVQDYSHVESRKHIQELQAFDASTPEQQIAKLKAWSVEFGLQQPKDDQEALTVLHEPYGFLEKEDEEEAAAVEGASDWSRTPAGAGVVTAPSTTSWTSSGARRCEDTAARCIWVLACASTITYGDRESQWFRDEAQREVQRYVAEVKAKKTTNSPGTPIVPLSNRSQFSFLNYASDIQLGKGNKLREQSQAASCGPGKGVVWNWMQMKAWPKSKDFDATTKGKKPFDATSGCKADYSKTGVGKDKAKTCAAWNPAQSRASETRSYQRNKKGWISPWEKNGVNSEPWRLQSAASKISWSSEGAWANQSCSRDSYRDDVGDDSGKELSQIRAECSGKEKDASGRNAISNTDLAGATASASEAGRADMNGNDQKKKTSMCTSYEASRDPRLRTSVEQYRSKSRSRQRVGDDEDCCHSTPSDDFEEVDEWDEDDIAAMRTTETGA